MVEGSKARAIGLLSNHPKSIHLFEEGKRGYRTNSWIVGPAYCLEHSLLREFLIWYEMLPNGSKRWAKGYYGDDSAINEFITSKDYESWHPIPTIIEHRGDLESTKGNGDKYSRERISWRMAQEPLHSEPGELIQWRPLGTVRISASAMKDPNYWAGEAPMLFVGEG
jgi:hypothetical protein